MTSRPDPTDKCGRSGFGSRKRGAQGDPATRFPVRSVLHESLARTLFPQNMSKKTEITEADWRTAMEEDIRAVRTPPRPPAGFFAFDVWSRIFDCGRTATGDKLADLTRLGVLEVQTFRAVDAIGRVTPRRFWRKRVKAKGGTNR